MQLFQIFWTENSSQEFKFEDMDDIKKVKLHTISED